MRGSQGFLNVLWSRRARADDAELSSLCGRGTRGGGCLHEGYLTLHCESQIVWRSEANPHGQAGARTALPARQWLHAFGKPWSTPAANATQQHVWVAGSRERAAALNSVRSDWLALYYSLVEPSLRARIHAGAPRRARPPHFSALSACQGLFSVPTYF